MTLLHFMHKDIVGECALPAEYFSEERVGFSPESYEYRGRVVESIWVSGEMRPHLARQLRPELRMVMGFWSQDSVPIIDKARMCGFLNSGEYLRLHKRLMTQEPFISVPAIRHCINNGLPRSAVTQIGGTLVCRNCGSKTQVLPCMFCWDGPDDDFDRIEADDPIPTKEDWSWFQKTRHPPGSREKIETMRLRAERYLPLFHDDDPSRRMSSASFHWLCE